MPSAKLERVGETCRISGVTIIRLFGANVWGALANRASEVSPVASPAFKHWWGKKGRDMKIG